MRFHYPFNALPWPTIEPFMNFVGAKEGSMLMPSIEWPIASLHHSDGPSVGLISFSKREANAEHGLILPVIGNRWLPTTIKKGQMDLAGAYARQEGDQPRS
jgi:hypothetical protein